MAEPPKPANWWSTPDPVAHPRIPRQTCPHRHDLLNMGKLDRVKSQLLTAHMLGHMVDHKAGAVQELADGTSIRAIPQDGLDVELRWIYNDRNNPLLIEYRRQNGGATPAEDIRFNAYGPEQLGITDAAARAELMADAIGSYLLAPEYVKAFAPKVLGRLREAVANNPVSEVVNFK